MWKSPIAVASKNVGLGVRVSDGLLRKPKSSAAVFVTFENGKENYSSSSSTKPVKHETPEPMRSGLQASYARGTGGRQSFSGNVVTVFGASGLLGRHVVNKLGKDGSQVIIPYRGDAYDVRHLKTAGDLGQILFFPFHLKDEDSIRKVVRYSNLVINLIGADFETRNFSFNEANAEGPARIARICREMGVKRFMHFSALNASENPEEHLIPGGSRFLRSKALGEKMIRDVFPEAMIIRPADIFGWQDRFIHHYCYSFRRNFLQQMCLYQKGDHTYKGPVHVYNVSKGVMRMVNDPTCDGKTFEFVGPYWYQLGDLIDWVFKIIHRQQTEYYMRRHIDVWHTVKTNIQELRGRLITRRPHFDWEKIERTEALSDFLTGCPTLTDLGVLLDTVEEKMPVQLNDYDKIQGSPPRLGEYPPPPWPKRYPPMNKEIGLKFVHFSEVSARTATDVPIAV